MTLNFSAHSNGSASCRAPAPGVSPQSRSLMRHPPRTPRSLHSSGKRRPTVRTSPGSFCSQHRERSGPSSFSCRSNVSPKDAWELTFERQEKADGPDLSRCWLQKEPARQLPNLGKLPIAIVTGEASFHGPYEHCVVKFLEQAGVHPTWLNLGAMGIHGNGHMIMLEKNSDQIARVIEKWVRKALAEKTARTPPPRAAAETPP